MHEQRTPSRRLTAPLAAAFLLASVGLSACAAAVAPIGESTPAPAEPATSAPFDPVLRIRERGDISNLDPAFFPTAVDSTIGYAVFEGLIQYKPGTEGAEVVNVLAETFEPSDDGLRYDFKLKENIQFHGGYGELTAEDVKFSYERIAGLTEPKIEAVNQADFATLAEVDVTGKYTGTIVLSKPFAPLLTSTLPVGSGLVVSKKAVEELGDEFATHPIGTGPYEFTSWTPTQEIVLTRFEGYGGAWQPTVPAPPWTQIVVLPITDDTAGLNAFEAGDVAWSKLPTQAIEQYTAGQGRGDVYRRDTLNYAFITLNVQDPQLANDELRQAIRYAIDVPGIVAAATDDTFTRARAIIPAGSPLGYWADAPQYDQDLAKAKDHLAASGLKDVKLRITTVDSEENRATVQVVQQNLEAIGIDATIDVQDGATFWEIPGSGGGGPDRQLVVLSFSSQPDPSWSFMWFTPDQVGLWNFTGWVDDRFGELYDQALAETDPVTRHELYVELQRHWDEAANVIWTYYPTLYFAAAENLQPAFIPPTGQPYIWAFLPK